VVPLQIGRSFALRPRAPTTLCYLRLAAAPALGLLSVASRCLGAQGRKGRPSRSTTYLTACMCGHRGGPIRPHSGPQLLAFRRLSPCEPPVPVAYALAQPGPLNSELSTGDLRVRVAITVLLRVRRVEHDGLLICAVTLAAPLTGNFSFACHSLSRRVSYVVGSTMAVSVPDYGSGGVDRHHPYLDGSLPKTLPPTSGIRVRHPIPSSAVPRPTG